MAGWGKRLSTTVATRAPAARARQRYSTSSPQMKNSSRGRPMRSTRSRVRRTPLKGMTTSSSRPSRAARVTSARSCTTRAVPGMPDREAEPVGRALGDHGRAEEVVAVECWQQVGQAVRRRRAVVVHQPEQGGRRAPRPAPCRRGSRLLPRCCGAGAAPRSARELVDEPGADRGRVVGRGVVDDDQQVGHPGLGVDGPHDALEQGGAVPGDDDGDERVTLGRGHAATLDGAGTNGSADLRQVGGLVGGVAARQAADRAAGAAPGRLA